MPISFKGQDKTDLLNYPPHTATTLFLSYCNFRCPYCQNPDLVLRFEKIPDIPEEKVLEFLDSRKNWIDGVCITGGEPTLHKELPSFIRKVKEKGFLVKLDTNGTNPEVVESLLKERLLDYVAMDIKAPREKYEAVVKAKVSMFDIERTIKLLKGSSIDYEFRTTVAKELLTEEDIMSIAEWLKGAKKYVLQQYRAGKTLDPAFKGTNYAKEELEGIKKKITGIGKVELRLNQ